jgi:hypothetical protein
MQSNTTTKHLKLKAMELLNGKAKELFWKWFLEPETLKKHKLDAMLKFSNEASVKVHVYAFPEICQNALIIEWLDSVGYNIHTDNLYDCFYFKIRLEFEEIISFEKVFNSRQEATTEAIKKAVELINESNGK